MKIADFIKIAIENNASDLHLKAGSFPILRISGELKPLTQFPRLSAENTQDLVGQITNDAQKEQLKTDLDMDLAYTLEGFGRFRGSILHQRGSLAIALRIIPLEIMSIRELYLPEILGRLSLEKRGLILVTGSTGSGKSTTLAAMINNINLNQSSHIITIEDPIEFIHLDKKCLISQREVGKDVVGFARGLRAALREDPDVILVGEMRDKETIETALLAAETGHLVLSTLHTVDATETINRIVSVFPPFHQRQIRIQLSSTLRAVISMRLIPKKEGEERVPAVEVMINTPFIAECIHDKEKTNSIRDAIERGASQYNMQTFDQSIFKLYKTGLISFEQGLAYASSPDDFKLKAMGVRSSLDMAMEDIEKQIEIDTEEKGGNEAEEEEN
jgi:twitching motility protein PilT